MTEDLMTPYIHKLTWSRPTGGPRPTPDGIERTFLSTPSGPLDLHFALPTTTSPLASSTNPPLLFIHGGFGSSLCYKNYLPFFSSFGYSSYAISLRGHGDSYNPGYLKLYFTSRQTFLSDLRYAIRHIQTIHGTSPILIGHSAGGGLAQDLIAQNLEPISGLVLLSAIPGYGSYLVNFNWLKFDPYMTIRMVFLHFFHPRSPLSSTSLVHTAFFSSQMPLPQIREVERTMAHYESMFWPLSMRRQFVDPVKVIKNLLGTWADERKLRGNKTAGQSGRILVVAGEGDKLMTLDLMTKLAEWYRAALITIRLQEKKDDNDESPDIEEGDEGQVELKVAPGVGHHMMLDVRWRESAEIVLEWLQKTSVS
ncbi:alpha/beta-hydrolase [Pluteus cervinus]|uniref:Alpha/beta-hydrolase n=1 Tax=Pluteus cervinus TaxID=181527 RepID=A0ACD3AAC6_9AGAR|nr:alpha/beta-hydrolase [Pluteus cervinus]